MSSWTAPCTQFFFSFVGFLVFRFSSPHPQKKVCSARLLLLPVQLPDHLPAARRTPSTLDARLLTTALDEASTVSASCPPHCTWFPTIADPSLVAVSQGSLAFSPLGHKPITTFRLPARFSAHVWVTQTPSSITIRFVPTDSLSNLSPLILHAVLNQSLAHASLSYKPLNICFYRRTWLSPLSFSGFLFLTLYVRH